MREIGPREGAWADAAAAEGLPGFDPLAHRYRAVGELAVRDIAGETVIVPVRGSVAELGSIFVVNEVGGRVWQLLGDRRTGREAVAAVVEEFEVAAEEAARDVAALLASLVEAGLVRPCAEEEG